MVEAAKVELTEEELEEQQKAQLRAQQYAESLERDRIKAEEFARRQAEIAELLPKLVKFKLLLPNTLAHSDIVYQFIGNIVDKENW